MPNRNSKNKNSVNSNRRSRAQRKKFNSRVRANSRTNPMMRGAPVAVSEDMQQYTYFTSCKDGLRMHVRAPAFQIFSTAVTGQGLASLLPDSAGPGRTAVQLNLTHPQGADSVGTVADADYVSPVWDLIASAFVRYRIKQCKFVYEPQSTATAAGRMVFAFAEDPLHPVLWKVGLTSNDILSVSDSIAFMPWKSWEMDVSHRLDNTLYYTYSDPSVTLLGFTERFSDWGVCACLTDTENATPQIGGILYMETTIELVEFCPITTVPPSSAKRLKMKLAERASTGRPIGSKMSNSSSSSSNNSITNNPTVVSSQCAHVFGTVTDSDGVKHQLCRKCLKVHDQEL